MTSSEIKIVQYKKLIADIKTDAETVRALATNISELADQIRAYDGEIPQSDLMLCAAYLHHFYTGIEAIFGRISRIFDGGVHPSGDYHRELLRSMTIGIPTVRPAIISSEFAEELDEYRRFRHMFRHAYGSELRWRKMEPLALDVLRVMQQLENSIASTIDFTQELIEALETKA